MTNIWPASGLIGERRYQGTRKLSAEPLLFIVSGRNRGYFAAMLLAEAARVLRPGGRLILLQPNFRLNPGSYFDDYTHVAIYTDRSLPDYLVSQGWRIVRKYPRFLPLTMKSKGSALTFLVPWYLRSPVKPLAGQMLVIATPVAGASRHPGSDHVER